MMRVQLQLCFKEKPVAMAVTAALSCPVPMATSVDILPLGGGPGSTVYCPGHYTSGCKTSFLLKSLSAQCSAAWSVLISSLACPLS